MLARLVCLAAFLCTTALAADKFEICLSTVASSPVPTSVVDAGDGSNRLFVSTQRGYIYIIKNGTRLSTPFLNISSKIPTLGQYDERGLVGLTFHPNYATNGRFFIFYSSPAGGGVTTHNLAEYTVSGGNADLADPNSEQILLSVNKTGKFQIGGGLQFNKADGMLYVGIAHGDNTSTAQDLTSLAGKILRLNVTTPGTYSVPTNNPFVSDGTARGEIYAYGLRNPFRFSFDRSDSTKLVAADPGSQYTEEIDMVTSGGNFGWDQMEGNDCLPAYPNCNKALYVAPYYTYPSSSDVTKPSSPIGGYIVRSTLMPYLTGKYVFADYSKGLIYLDGPSGSVKGTEVKPSSLTSCVTPVSPSNVYALGEDSNGHLYVVFVSSTTFQGTIYRMSTVKTSAAALLSTPSFWLAALLVAVSTLHTQWA